MLVRRDRTLLAALAVGALAALTAWAATEADSRVPRPQPVAARGERCVEPTEFMVRNHMNLLKHQRDETVHRGIRTVRYSLQGCVDCHASARTSSVLGATEGFCQGCHSYAGVTLDCFECHSSKARPGPLAAEPTR
jgi:hypothetical protein